MLPGKDYIVRIIYLIVYVLISSTGLLLIKLGSGENRFIFEVNGIGVYFNRRFIIGALLYVFSFCLFTFKIVTFDQLNTIYPVAVGMGLIVTFILSIVILHETISIKKVVAFLMIVAGCILIRVKE